MSCGNKHATPCADVLNSVDLLLDGEITENSVIHNITIHLEECMPCKSEMEHERHMHALLHEVLTRSCCEKAPEELHQALAMQIAALRSQSADIFTEYRRTEISIQIDEFGSIEHQEITIEHTQEYRLPTED